MKHLDPAAHLLRSTALGVSAVTLLIAVACQRGDGGLTRLQIQRASGGSAALQAEIADTPEELQKGLAGRSGLATDRGMLFVIEKRGPGFWMKDVSIPLSVAFVGRCGEIVDIQDMEPLNLFFHDTPYDFRFGLEVNGGWFGSHAVRVGDRLVLPGALRSKDCPT